MSSQPPDEYPPAVADRWEELLADATATAEELREDGWDVLVLHPGDVTPLFEDRFGLDVLAPSDEFDELEALVEDHDFDLTSVYTAEDGDARFYIVVAQASETERAVVIPAFLAMSEQPPLQQRADDAGVMYTHVRPLSGDVAVTFRHDEPSLFF